MVTHLPFSWCGGSFGQLPPQQECIRKQDRLLQSFCCPHIYSLHQGVYCQPTIICSISQSRVRQLMVAHLPSLGVVPPFGQLSECVYSLHQSVQCLQQSFYCFYTASVSTAYTRVFIAYSILSIAFTQRVCLQLTLECLLLTLVFLLLYIAVCLQLTLECLLLTFYCFDKASVCIAYTGVSIFS